MALNSSTKYPNRRTYVLRVRSDATPGAIAGRLENVVTGRQRDFTSDRELAEWLASDLSQETEERPADEPGAKP